MRRKSVLTIILALVSVLLIALGFAACSDGDGGGDDPGEIELELNRTEADIIYGSKLELVATYTEREGLSLVWESSDTSIATVDNGTVTTVGIGTVTIKVTYGDKSKSCVVRISYGSYVPQLVIDAVDVSNGNKISLLKGDKYKLQAAILFNGEYYEAESLSVTGANSQTLDYNATTRELEAKSTGDFSLTVSAAWRGFSGALLSNDVTVSVLPAITANTYLTVDGNRTPSNSATLYLTENWYGETNVTTALLEVVAEDASNPSSTPVITSQITEGDDLITLDSSGNITVKESGKAGDAVIEIDIESNGDHVSSTVTIHVVCPTATDPRSIEYSEETGLVGTTWETILPSGATILSTGSKQGETALTYAGGKFTGLKASGSETEAITVLTSKGIVTFTNVYAYTAELTAGNIVNKLKPNTKPSGYYILKGDVTADFTSQSNGDYDIGNFFTGTFDGRGNTLNATVGAYGIFGSIGLGAVVKDTHFNFTFDDTKGVNATGWDLKLITNYKCGFASNDSTKFEGYENTACEMTFQNLYITTTNYFTNSFIFMVTKPLEMKMFDVYINITGLNSSTYGTYTDASTQSGVLFGADRLMRGNATAQAPMSDLTNGRLVNRVYVITGQFVPLSANRDYENSSTRVYAWYARNDVDGGKLGNVGHRGGAPGEVNYLQIYNNNGSNTSYDKLYGAGNSGYSYTGVSPYLYRYDTIGALKAANGSLNKIGSWQLNTTSGTATWQA